VITTRALRPGWKPGPFKTKRGSQGFSLTVKADPAIAFLVKLRGREVFFDGLECVTILFFRPVGALVGSFSFPTAYAVGFILSPLRG